MSEQLHATCVSVNGHGVLLLGGSGTGKSDLALRLIDTGAMLVADDQVIIKNNADRVYADCPPQIHGKLEVRGMGIMTMAFVQHIRLLLAVQLVAREQVERIPEAEFFDCLGVRLPLLSLYAFDLSAPAKIRLWLSYYES